MIDLKVKMYALKDPTKAQRFHDLFKMIFVTAEVSPMDDSWTCLGTFSNPLDGVEALREHFKSTPQLQEISTKLWAIVLEEDARPCR